MKTVSVALVICLNVGVDPPDVTKTDPCARQAFKRVKHDENLILKSLGVNSSNGCLVFLIPSLWVHRVALSILKNGHLISFQSNDLLTGKSAGWTRDR